MSSLGKICLQVIMSLHLDDRTGTAVKGIDMKNPRAKRAKLQCLSLENMQFCDVLVAVVIVVIEF